MAHEQFKSCIEECLRCAQECEQCVTACLGEADVQRMAECVRLDRDTADFCRLAATLMSRGSPLAAAVCRACAEACGACGAECGKHQDEHCRRCAEACRRCAEECGRMAA